MAKIIDQLLEEIQEDKKDNLSTTSFRFKKDLWKFFDKKKYRKRTACEFGTHKGQTTRILSHLFNEVYTINIPGHLEQAMELNKDRNNIGYLGFDLYSNIRLSLPKKPSIFFIDAVHEYNAVMSDFDRVKEEMDNEEEVYVIFDDYGLIMDVHIAVSDLIENGEITMIQGIGHQRGHDFGHGRILKDWEGCITTIVK